MNADRVRYLMCEIAADITAEGAYSDDCDALTHDVLRLWVRLDPV